jgi:hypothetical protein
MRSPDPVSISKDIETRHPIILRKGGELHDRLMKSFLPYSCVTLNAGWGNPDAPFVLPMTPENTPEYKTVRRELIFRFPASYLAYRTEYMQYLLGFYQTPGAGRNGWVLSDLRIRKNALAGRYVAAVENTWLMAPVIWFAVCGLTSLLLLMPVKRANPMSEPVGWVALSAVGVVAVLYIVGPAPDYRYMFWPTTLGILLTVWLPFQTRAAAGANVGPRSAGSV